MRSTPQASIAGECRIVTSEVRLLLGRGLQHFIDFPKQTFPSITPFSSGLKSAAIYPWASTGKLRGNSTHGCFALISFSFVNTVRQCGQLVFMRSNTHRLAAVVFRVVLAQRAVCTLVGHLIGCEEPNS